MRSCYKLLILEKKYQNSFDFTEPEHSRKYTCKVEKSNIDKLDNRK